MKKNHRWVQEKKIIQRIYKKYDLSISLTASDRSVAYALLAAKKTISAVELLLDKSKTVLWNGPAGYFENPDFAVGSKKIVKKIVDLKKNIYSVAGGGDTIALLNNENALEKLDFVSTAGGAFLEYLEGKEIPGIRALKK